MVRVNRAKAKLLAGEIAGGGSLNFYAPITSSAGACA